jgi:hypothetical protein
MPGNKFDVAKPAMGLLPRYALEQMALVLAYGEAKYGRHNWREGIEVQRSINAALRHIYAANESEDNDPESGFPHLAHALCCLMFAMTTIEEQPQFDDRLAPARRC